MDSIFLVCFALPLNLYKQGISSPPSGKKEHCLLPVTVQDISPFLARKHQQNVEISHGICPSYYSPLLHDINSMWICRVPIFLLGRQLLTDAWRPYILVDMKPLTMLLMLKLVYRISLKVMRVSTLTKSSMLLRARESREEIVF